MVRFSSAPRRGWVARQELGSTIVKLVDGGSVRANRSPTLDFGTPVRVQLFHRLREGTYDGAIISASPLPAISNPDMRPIAIFDMSNVAGLSDVALGEVYGLPAVWSLAWAVDSAGWSVHLLDDPCSDRFWHRESVSSATLFWLKNRPFSSRWPRLVKSSGPSRHSAEVAAFSHLRLNQTSVFISADAFRERELHALFPELEQQRFKSRIFRPEVLLGEISVPELDIPPAVIATSLFTR